MSYCVVRCWCCTTPCTTLYDASYIPDASGPDALYDTVRRVVRSRRVGPRRLVRRPDASYNAFPTALQTPPPPPHTPTPPRRCRVIKQNSDPRLRVQRTILSLKKLVRTGVFIGHTVQCTRQYCETAVTHPWAHVAQPFKAQCDGGLQIEPFRFAHHYCKIHHKSPSFPQTFGLKARFWSPVPN